jgi:poly(3-hydroxybutyrate) depolymerase
MTSTSRVCLALALGWLMAGCTSARPTAPNDGGQGAAAVSGGPGGRGASGSGGTSSSGSGGTSSSGSGGAGTGGSGGTGSSGTGSGGTGSGGTGSSGTGGAGGGGGTGVSGTGGSGGGGSGGSGGSGSSGCGHANSQTGSLHLTTTDGNGTTRNYDLVVPASYDASKPLSLVFVYHGAGGNEAAAKSFGLQDASGAGSAAIFVFPRGISFQQYGVGWNDACSGYDMVLFDHMLAAVQAAYCIDPAKVFAAGFSWGCDQVTALACCRGDRLRAIAAASCTDEYSNGSDYTTYNNLPCPAPKRPAIRFTHDASGGDEGYAAPLFVTTSALYRSFDGCSATSTPTADAHCSAHASCAQPFIDCGYDQLGHQLPPNWADDTWKFFSTLP